MPLLTEGARKQAHAVDDPQGFLLLVEINHPSFTAPIRLVQDNDDLIVGGITYVALPMQIQLPQDVAKEAARAKIVIDNVGRDLGGEFERLGPGASLDVTLRNVSRATPGIVEYEFVSGANAATLDLTDVSLTLGDDEWMRMGIVNLRADPTTSPGLHAG